MERKFASAEQIRQEIDLRLNTEQGVLKDHARIGGQLPERIEGDGDGSNWRVSFVGDITGHEDEISRAVSEVQGLYNLKE